MLANGQGKSRSSKTGASRRVPTWNLTFLSSGEVSISDRADQAYKNKAMAGHEVRVVSILADGGAGYGIFTTIPDGMPAGEFSDMLVQNSKEYRGAPLRAMIQHIKGDQDKICDAVSEHMAQFLDGLDRTTLSSQAKRVADHFALLAGVGEVATALDIVPWQGGEAMDAMRHCFDWWLRDRSGAVDFEIEKATEKLLCLARKEFYGKFIDDYYPVRNIRQEGKDCFFIPRSYAVAEICKDFQYKALVANLKEKGLLILTKDGEVREQCWQGGNDNRPRGFAIIRDRLYGESAAGIIKSPLPLGEKLSIGYQTVDDNDF
jgi:Superfamily II helicase and inactivated derivatives